MSRILARGMQAVIDALVSIGFTEDSETSGKLYWTADAVHNHYLTVVETSGNMQITVTDSADTSNNLMYAVSSTNGYVWVDYWNLYNGGIVIRLASNGNSTYPTNIQAFQTLQWAALPTSDNSYVYVFRPYASSNSANPTVYYDSNDGSVNTLQSLNVTQSSQVDIAQIAKVYDQRGDFIDAEIYTTIYGMYGSAANTGNVYTFSIGNDDFIGRMSTAAAATNTASQGFCFKLAE